MKTRKRSMLCLLLSLIALSCTLADLTGTAQTPLPAAETTPSTPPDTSVPDTPVPDVEGPGGCTLNAGYVADITIPDDTAMTPGQTFIKTWRLNNTGTCTWEAGTQLIYVSGDPLGGPAAVDVGAVAPGSNVDVSVSLVAPSIPGTYRSNWQMQAPDGTNFGSIIYVQIIVPAETTPTPEPTETPTETPTQPPLATNLRVTDLTLPTDVEIINTPIHLQATLHNDGSENLTNVTVRIESHYPHTLASCTNMDMVNTVYETTVNLGPNESLPFNQTFQVADAWEHLICIKIDPDDAITETNEDDNYQGESILVGVQSTVPMDAANSGAIDRDGNVASIPQAGDHPSDIRVKAFMSWDIVTTLGPGVEILSAAIAWNNTGCYHGGSSGACTGQLDAFAQLGTLRVRRYYYGTLDSGDFNASGLQGGTVLANYDQLPTSSLDVTQAVQEAYESAFPFQVYSLFEYGDNGDGMANGVRFYEDSGSNELVIVYIP